MGRSESANGGDVVSTLGKSVADDEVSRELSEFLADLQSAGRSPGTLRFYTQKLRPFTVWLRDQGIADPRQIGPSCIRLFMTRLRPQHSPGGCHAYWRAIRAFVRFLMREGVLEQNPLLAVRAPTVEEQPLEPVDPQAVTAMVAACDNSVSGLRDKSLLLALLDTGMRAGEATSLHVGDVDLRDGCILVRRSKSRRPRSVFLGRESRRALNAYLRTRSAVAPEEPLWLAYHTTGERGPLSYTGLRDIVRRRAKQAGTAAPTLHSFRRGFAITMLRAGADIVSLGRMMGHGSLPVLMRYLKQETVDLQRVHACCSPTDRLFGRGQKPQQSGVTASW